MSKDKFVLVNLNEAKELGQVITNDTCLKILDFLADREATESDIAKAMDLPLSTVHYNITHLVKGGLVVAEEFHYSPKGKEVNHYKLAHKYIIIAPRTVEKTGLKAKLRSLLPASLIALAGAGILSLWKNPSFQKASSMAAVDTGISPLQPAIEQAARVSAEQAAAEGAKQAVAQLVSQQPVHSAITAGAEAASKMVTEEVARTAVSDAATSGAAAIAPAAAPIAQEAATKAAASATQQAAVQITPQISQSVIDQAAQKGTEAGMTAAAQLQQSTTEIASAAASQPASWMAHPAIWFLAGAVIVVLVVVIIELIRKKD